MPAACSAAATLPSCASRHEVMAASVRRFLSSIHAYLATHSAGASSGPCTACIAR